jgi:hypothetical protein
VFQQISVCQKGMQKASKDTRVALAGCYLSSSPHTQRITAEWGNIHQTKMTVEVGKVRHFNGLSLNDSDGSRHPLLLCGCRIHSLCGGVTVGSGDCTVCVDVTHLRSAPRTAHPLAPNALKIYRHSSSCIAPVLVLATRRGERVSNPSSPLSTTKLCW